jgi:protein-S-isoprenylcysteine O-methyltransferase Ste14
VSAALGDKVKPEDGEHPFGDAGQLILFLCFMIVWVGDSFFLRVSTFASVSLPLSIRLLVTAFAMIIAVYLAKAGHGVVNHEHRLPGVVSTGAFRYVRHPLYLASLLFYFGLGVSTACLSSFGLLMVICLFYNYIASYEEKLLVVKFGEDYLHYKNRTGNWIPKLKL